MSTVNIKTLARALNLSISTISKALRDSHEINSETKKKVWEMARQLNYQPNPLASGLRQQRSGTIAVIFPELVNDFFAQAVNGIETAARKNNYQVLIYVTHELYERELTYVNGLSAGRADGLLISLSRQSGNMRHLTELNQKIPVVLFDRVCGDCDAYRVMNNDYESSFNATAYLIGRGCKKIAYLSALGSLAVGQTRRKGYLDALIEGGLPADPALLVDCELDDPGNYRLIKELLISQRPDAVLSSIEKLAPLIYLACQDLGINIPAEVKLISFSNLATAALLNPPLTTISQPAFDIGAEAARMLFLLLAGKEPEAVAKTINSTLEIRGSA